MRVNAGHLFTGLVLVCVVGLAIQIHWVRTRQAATKTETVPTETVPPHVESVREPEGEPTPEAESLVLPDVATRSPSRPQPIYFRSTAVDAHYGHLAFITDFTRQNRQFVDGFTCEVVHVAGGRGICLTADRGVVTTYAAELFDADFRRRSTLQLRGVPSRSRVSPDGKLAGLTVFVNGHSYTSLDFSTETLLLDTTTGTILANVESFAVTLGGQPFRAQDFNFWGVTFTPDSQHFYCTLSSNRKHYLVEADIATRTASVIHENVECPSVSPDGTRIAYKKRFVVDGRIVWQLHVLDLKTMQETSLGEQRSVDDQLEWLDNDHVLYALPQNSVGSSAGTDVWQLRTTGEQPRLFLSNAYSAAVAR